MVLGACACMCSQALPSRQMCFERQGERVLRQMPHIYQAVSQLQDLRSPRYSKSVICDMDFLSKKPKVTLQLLTAAHVIAGALPSPVRG